MPQPSVVIAGAGLGGLSTAVFLGLHGVDTLVVERHAGLSTQPKARGQMPATMEALAAAGIGVHGRQRRAPAAVMFASFDADLRPALDGAAVGLWHIQNAALPYGNATVFTTDDPGRFVIGGGFSEADASPDRLIEHIRTAAGVPDLAVRKLDVAWTSGDTWITRRPVRLRVSVRRIPPRSRARRR